MGEPSERDKNRKLGEYLRYSGLGIQFLVSVGLCVWAGSWLDGKVGTSPLFLLLGTLLGFAAGTWALLKEVYGRRR